MSEMILMNSIKTALKNLGYAVFRANVGKVRLADGRFFDTGLPRGFSDLFAVKDGRICFIEVKVKPNKPTIEQIDFIEKMKLQGCTAGVVYSIQEAIDLCKGWR